MKTIGIIGGMSWESTALYYEIINNEVKKQLGGLHSAKVILYSVDFEEIEKYQANGEWQKSADLLSSIAKKLEGAGADFILIATNTMHKIAPLVMKNINIPLVHIADVTADAIIKENIDTIALIGTKYTMTEDFYKQRLIDKNIDVLIPSPEDIEIVNNIIYNELCLGIINESSKKEYIRIVNNLITKGAKGVIFGCTEVGMLIKAEDFTIPSFDTTIIHALSATHLAI